MQRREHRSVALQLVAKMFREKVCFFLEWRRFNGDREAAAAAWNDTLYRIWTRSYTYDQSKSRLQSWVSNQARYAAFDVRRRRCQWRPPVEYLEGGRHEPRTEDDRPTPLGEVEAKMLRRAFTGLNERDRNLVSLRWIDELEPVEIARAGLAGSIPEDQIRVYIKRATDRLRRLYERESAAEEASGLRPLEASLMTKL